MYAISLHCRVVALLALAGAGCGGDQASASRTLESSYALGTEAAIFIQSVVPIAVIGERRDDLALVVEATVTASAADVAERALDAWAPEVDVESSPGTVIYVIGHGSEGNLSGTAEVRIPRDMDLRVLSSNGDALVQTMTSDIRVDALATVAVLEPRGNVDIRVESGTGLVRGGFRSGTTTTVRVGSGNAQLEVPSSTSLTIEADTTAGIASSHPSFPSRAAGLTYTVSAGSGSATAIVEARSGGLYILSQD